jgi:hypothetical protein
MSTEQRLRDIAKQNGYRIEKNGDSYILIDERSNAIMFYYDNVDLDTIAKFFEEPIDPRSGRPRSFSRTIGKLKQHICM